LTRYTSGYKAGVARYSSAKKAIAGAVVVRGMTRYQTRFSDYDDYDPGEKDRKT